MTRISRLRHKLGAIALMAVYVVLMLFEWPLVAGAPSLAVRVVLAVLPALPMVGAIALLARRVMCGDEMEQRVHLIALSVAVGVVSAASIVGGFLVAAQVWPVGGDILFWVFPALGLVYGITRVGLMRKLAGSWSFLGR